VAPAVLTAEELPAIVEAIQQAGAFSFDVETRGNVDRHPDVLDKIEKEWQEKLATLKTTHQGTLDRSRQAIVDRWAGELALDEHRNEVFWIGIAIDGQSWAIPMGHPNGEVLIKEMRGDGHTTPPKGFRDILKSGKESTAKKKYFIPAVFSEPPQQLTTDVVFAALEEVFLDDDIVKVNQNIKFDCKSVAKYLGGRLPTGLYVDPQDLMHIVNENLINYKLQTVLKETFDFDPYHRVGKLGKTITTEAFSAATTYVHYDARWAWLTYKHWWRRIAKIEGLYTTLQLDSACMRPVAQMEYNGIAVNKREMLRFGQELDVDLNRVIMDIGLHAPPGFNPGSVQQKQRYLFGPKKDENGKATGNLGLKPTKWTDTKQPSVDDEALRAQMGKHPIIDYIIEYQELSKMKSTYVTGLEPLLHPIKGQRNLGKLHPSFHFHRTTTGRFSSSDPNLQNIPRDGRMRALFVAEPGDSLIDADYSQIEMRLMAMYSQDPALLRIFREGIDVHTGTAAVILKKAFEDITPDERQLFGKTPNFLMGYGGQARRLQMAVRAEGGNITFDEAQFIVDGYNNGYAGLTDWKESVIRFGRRYGYVETLGGRRRRVPDINMRGSTKEEWKARSRAERQAINAVIQGTAAEICKRALVELDKVLEWPKCRMVLQVHDEIVTAVPTDEAGLWLPQIEKSMGNGVVLDANGTVNEGVELVVEAHFAGSWYDAKG